MNLARRTMNEPALAAVYERAWRPALFYLASGRTTSADRRDAVRTLRLGGDQKVLDIACGPGNFTRYLSNALTGGGYAVGLDYSEPMLARARIDNSGPRVGYLRGDARRLPFQDAAFDAVCCFGALYLIPDPLTATREMIRVLAPGGRIAISTSHRWNPPFSQASKIAGGWIGLRVFDTETFPALFAEHGLVDIEQRIHRSLQYVSATRPR
ncbi:MULTISPECIES: class I SAM-dependent methyltransferase [unclassified Nocardia]|uniref:class I SAM-dependent methyltransferase n=1 Tax=unclassified Nocardia TaxID=2637762 RepID=UPI001CE45EEE|nr:MULTISPECIES: methyltransferase domain-containing protein [unclassified Nocardia]